MTVSEICQKALDLHEKQTDSSQMVSDIAHKVQDVITNIVPALVAEALKTEERERESGGQTGSK